MDAESFREFGKAAVDYLADYLENIRERQVLPSIEPGYMRKLLPEEAPEESEDWRDVLKDMDRAIMPGMTHWHSPHFHAYYPTANSYPGIVGELMSAGLGTIGFTWMSSPASTELEVITLDWLGKMMGLPNEFLSCSDGHGGGVIQGSASEATLLCLIVARERYAQRLQEKNPKLTESELRSAKAKLIAYTSDQSNSSVEKAGILGSVPMRLVPCDKNFRMRACALRAAMEKDVKNGLTPCIVISTLGTTPTCANDPLDEISVVCKEFNVWHHVDAAYSGAAFICPEFRHIYKGIEDTDSFNFNPHKWMLVNFDCSALWVKDSRELVAAMSVDRAYLAHTKENAGMPDFRNWQIPLGRRFRSLKLWFVLRIYGVKKLQEHIRTQCKLAEDIEELIKRDDRLEIFTPAHMGLVCFRIKGPNEYTKSLMANMQKNGKIYVVGAEIGGKSMIRFAICSRLTNSSDIDFAWNEISLQTDQVLGQKRSICPNKSLEIMNGQK